MYIGSNRGAVPINPVVSPPEPNNGVLVSTAPPFSVGQKVTICVKVLNNAAASVPSSTLEVLTIPPMTGIVNDAVKVIYGPISFTIGPRNLDGTPRLYQRILSWYPTSADLPAGGQVGFVARVKNLVGGTCYQSYTSGDYATDPCRGVRRVYTVGA
jgi:hypothetical protein